MLLTDFIGYNVRDLSRLVNERAAELLTELGRPKFTVLGGSVVHTITDLEHSANAVQV